jgi:hypothetical protein
MRPAAERPLDRPTTAEDEPDPRTASALPDGNPEPPALLLADLDLADLDLADIDLGDIDDSDLSIDDYPPRQG